MVKKTSLTLDPENWNKTRELAHQMVDDMFDYLSSVRERPAWQTVSAESKAHLTQDVPYKGQALEEVYDEFKRDILPFPTGNQHPRFFGWVMGNGTVTSMLADMLASGFNPHLAGYDQSGSLIEKQVITWFKKLIGFPESASGLLVSGGTMANINALSVARNTKAGFDIREDGLQDKQPELTLYGSSETHSWVYKACELMGLGRKAFRSIPVDGDYKINIDACREAIEADIKAGKKPFCIIATVGTVNTGAYDDIKALRALADKYDLWLHIDGAFGALAALAPDFKERLKVQALADSIGFDLHKWGYMSFEIACVLIKDGDRQIETFHQSPSYLTSSTRGLSAQTTYFADKGLQLSRGFRALKAWMSLKEHGVDKLGQLIQQNIDQAQYLKTLIETQVKLEVLAPVSLNIVCFRYIKAGLSTEALNELNKEILMRLQESGVAVPSQTILQGRYAIRACITNHRTENFDLELLVNECIRLGDEILQETR